MDSKILNHVRSPASYIGCEWGVVRKTPANGGPRWALAFPDAYEIGMSHLGIQILYHILNQNPESSAERVFAPRMDMQELLKKAGAPLCSLETETPLNKFDVVGFSLLYELGYTNVLHMLELGGIPLHSANRGPEHPLIIGGGPCVTNPEPVAPFFDAFALGEGEDVVLDINRVVHGAKRGGLTRDTLLEKLAKVEGVYVPAIHRQSENIEILARKVKDLDAAPFCIKPVVPSVEATHDRAAIEISRGCPHACRFCHAGYLGRPHRERKPSTVWKLALEVLACTGYQDLTLLSLSAGDYSCLTQLVAALSAHFGKCGIAVNLPSLRADSLTDEVVREIRAMRKTGFTIAPEAGSARLRAVINKDVTEDEILRTARIIFENGWDLIKLYFMFGLPTETGEDLKDIGRLVRAVRKEGLNAGTRPRINVSLSAFVPKPHTPFQWEEMLSEAEIKDRLASLRNMLRIPGVSLKWSPAFMSVLEGVFARGDSRLAPAIERAASLGAGFDAWGDELDPALWKRVFELEGLNSAEFAGRRRAFDEKLPWEHLKTGVDKAWLIEERGRAVKGEKTLGCENAPCPDPCGACDREVEAIRFDKLDIELPPVRPPELRENFARFRFVYSKLGPARWIGHLDTVRVFQRSLRRAGIMVQYTEGFHPKPRLSFGEALPVGVASLVEMVDVWVHKSENSEGVLDRVNMKLPDGFKVTAAREIPVALPSIEKATRRVRYRFENGASGEVDRAKREESAGRFRTAPDWWIEKVTKSGADRVDLKCVVGEIAISDDGAIEMEFAGRTGEAKVRPILAYEALFGPLPDDACIIKVAAAVDGF